MLRLLVGTSAINFAGTAAQLVAVVLLGRMLPADDYGRMHLILAAVPVLATIATLGQPAAATRTLAARAPGSIAWRGYALAVSGIIVALCVLSVPALRWLWDFTWIETAYTVLAAGGFGGAQFFAAGILRSAARPHAAMLFARGWALVLLALLALAPPENVGDALALLVVCHLVTALGAAGLVLRFLPSGPQAMGPQVWRDGMWFWLITLSLVFGRQMDRLSLGGAVDAENLAAYGALITVLGGFDLMSFSIGFLLAPMFAQRGHPKLGRRTLEVGLLALAGVGVYLLWGEWLLSVLFGGRYDHAATLLPILIGAGVLKVAYAVPSALLGGRLESSALKRFAIGNIVLMILTIAGTALLAARWGLWGASLATAGFWALRLVFALVVAVRSKERADLGEDPADAAG